MYSLIEETDQNFNIISSEQYSELMAEDYKSSKMDRTTRVIIGTLMRPNEDGTSNKIIVYVSGGVIAVILQNLTTSII